MAEFLKDALLDALRRIGQATIAADMARRA